MAGTVRLSLTRNYRVPLQVLWDFLADTDRMNRALGLPSVRFQPDPDPSKKGYYRARAVFMGVELDYEEVPFEWVEGRYWRVVRRFSSGPFSEYAFGARLEASPEGTSLELHAVVLPRHALGEGLARWVVAPRALSDLHGLCRSLELHLHDPAAHPLPGLPPSGLVDDAQLAARADKLKALPVRGEMADRLAAFLRTSSDLEASRIRPFELADRWGEDRVEVLRFLLHAAQAGLVDLAWTVLCPSCHGTTHESGDLGGLKAEADCGTCSLGFGTDLASSVEARFCANAAVRTARKTTYCIGGPANTPQVFAQLRLAPGEKREETLPLRQGTLRVMCYQSGGPVDRNVVEGSTPASPLRVGCGKDGLQVHGGEEGLPPGPTGFHAENGLDREALLVLQRVSWREAAATAAFVTSLQDFRDLFPAQAVAPGEEIRVGCLALMFTDLKSSTELYRKVGDLKAFAMIQGHFKFLVEQVARHRGGLVKTMGDAVMASFSSARDALEAALEMLRRWDEFRRRFEVPRDVELKVGVHQGPAIAINNQGKLDYFGTTVNTAARVQAQAEGGTVMATEAVMEDPRVKALAAEMGLRFEVCRAELKGLEGRFTLYQARPDGRQT